MNVTRALKLAATLLVTSLVLASGAEANTTSPFQPPEEKLGRYVTNSGSGLDTGCTYRNGGPLIIKFRIPATVNPKQINADGTLKDPQKLIAAGLLGAFATIRMPVFDIDSGANTGGAFSPEIDRVSLNGLFKKTLVGLDSTWTDDSLVVPVGELRFDSATSAGVTNELRIDIDTGNAGVGEFWCMAVDWVATEFDTVAPYVLAHGINAQSDSWNDVVSILEDAGILFERFSLVSNGRSSTNALLLDPLIESFLTQTKSTVVNIIAHSKGGLDTQELQALGPAYKILSLSTLSTPHLGSVAADLSVIAKSGADDLVNLGIDPNGYVSTYIDQWTFGQGPQLPGLEDLTTYRATEAISSGLRGNIPITFTVGADADLNQDNDLTVGESNGLFPGVAHYAAERAWRVMRDFSSAKKVGIAQVPGVFFGTKTVLYYNSVEASAPQANDVVVTVKSANPAYGTPLGNYFANHSKVQNIAPLQKILEKTVPLR